MRLAWILPCGCSGLIRPCTSIKTRSQSLHFNPSRSIEVVHLIDTATGRVITVPPPSVSVPSYSADLPAGSSHSLPSCTVLDVDGKGSRALVDVSSLNQIPEVCPLVLLLLALLLLFVLAFLFHFPVSFWDLARCMCLSSASAPTGASPLISGPRCDQ